MKNTKVNNMKNIAYLILSVGILALASCNIGLGEALDLKGPAVTITSPEARENVQGEFSISGTVKDDFNIGKVTVTLDGNEWVNEENTWMYKPKGGNFALDTKSVWNLSSDGKSATWTINGAQLQSKVGGTFTIDVSAVDKTGNTSEESHKTRDVVVDKEPPKVSIASPSLKSENAFDSITDYKDITKISMFQTGDFSVSGKTIDDNTIKYVDLWITSKNCANIETDYYAYIRFVQDEKYSYKVEGDSSSGQAADKTKVVDSLRSWDVDIKMSEWTKLNSLDENKNVLKFVTKTEDMAGNIIKEEDNGGTQLITQGYACLWKDADKPWIEMNLGSSSTSPLNVFSGSKILGNAYDDTGIGSVTVSVYKGSSTDPISGWNKKSVYTSPAGENENNVFFEVDVPTDCDTYKVEINATDKKDNSTDVKSAEQKTGYIKVADKTFPSIEIEHYVGGVKKEVSDTLFGDATGNFTFKIKVKDDTKIKSLQMVYLTDPKDIITYSNAAYTGWSTSTTNLNDLPNKKAYTINVGTTSSGTEKDGTIIRKVFNATDTTINLFNNLKIGTNGHPLTNQMFVFRVEDGEGNAITKDYTILGDIKDPTITFTTLKYNSETKNYINEKKLPAFTNSSTVTIIGTISDNSADVWNTSSGKYSELKKGFTIKASTDSDNISLTPTWDTTNVNTFTATIPGTSLVGKSALTFDAELTDYAGNSTNEKKAYVVESQAAAMEFISSDTIDKYYGAGSRIDVFIQFNKELTFSKSKSESKNNIPTITLNNGGTANMTIPTAKTRFFHFTYTVPANATEIEKLDVTDVDLKGGKLMDGSEDVSSILTTALITGLSAEKKLSGSKSIGIITSIPTVQNAELKKSGNNYTLEITYNKDIEKGSGNVTITQENVQKVPAVLSRSKYNTLVSLEPRLAKFYDSGTNGAKIDGTTWKFDTEEKYILKYKFSADRTNESSSASLDAAETVDDNSAPLKKLYLRTNDHITTQSIKSYKASISGSVVTVDFGTTNPLKCKGATYKLEIDAGFVQDANGGDEFVSERYEVTEWKTASGLEDPVIRIKTGSANFDKNTKTATQPLTSEFKIDCLSPNITKTEYSYDAYITTTAIPVKGDQSSPITHSPVDKTNNKSKSNTEYTKAETIGGGDYKQGEKYEITATVTGNSTTATGRNIAYRTTIVALNINRKLPNGMKSAFISGGDEVAGPSSTPGFPLSWDPEKAVLLTKSDDDWYYTTWDINGDENTRCYCAFMAGNADAQSGTNGPAKFIYAQNAWVTNKKNYGVKPGYYITLDCNASEGGGWTFDTGTAEKVVTVR